MVCGLQSLSAYIKLTQVYNKGYRNVAVPNDEGTVVPLPNYLFLNSSQ